MDDGTDLVYFANDHLSSTSIAMSDTGTLLSEQRYLPFGGVRGDVGTLITETDFGYTGQRNLGGMGLMDYNARFYSPLLGRFVQPDSIVPNPGDSQAWNRYSYVGNNPMRFTDPTGHYLCKGANADECDIKDDPNIFPPDDNPPDPPDPTDPPGGGGNGGQPGDIDEDVTLVFCGGDGVDANNAGPSCDDQMYAYLDEGFIFIPYPGSTPDNKDAKYQQLLLAYAAIASLDLGPNAKLIIIGYSGGADTAIMFAEGKGNIKSLVLLGPTFSGGMNEKRDRMLGDEWSGIFDTLLGNDTNILVFNDKGWGSGQANNYAPPSGATGSFKVWSNPNFEHTGPDPNAAITWESTNNSSFLRGRVDAWLLDPNTPLYP